jgi:hypothetical protein
MAASRAVAQSRLEMPPDVQNAISQELELAANQIGHPTLRSIEIIICEGIPTSSPFVLGFLNPRIVIREDMLTLLIEKKWLRSVLCHELMHIVRRDHITRWFQLWLEDITTITLVGRMVGRSAFSYEEQLCDCGAIKDTMDAEALAFAITSTLKLRLDPPLTPTFSYFVSSPFPSLKGGSSAEKRGLMNRLSHISTYAQFILEESLINPRKISLVKSLLIFILGFVLFLAIYLRYYIFISV